MHLREQTRPMKRVNQKVMSRLKIALQTPVITLTTDQRQACARSTTYTLAVLEWFSRIHWKDVPNQQTSWAEMFLVSLSLEGVSQMVYILPERLLALVRPAFDLVLRRIRSLKRCVQA